MKQTTLKIPLCLFLLGGSICYGQSSGTNQQIETVKQSVINFLVDQKYLEKGMDANEYEKRIHIVELVEETALGFKNIGIYRIRVFRSHTKQFLLIYNDSTYQILDTRDLGQTLQNVVNFLVEHRFSNAKTSAYVERVIELHRINENRTPVGVKEG